MCSDERQFQPLVMTQSPSTSIPTTFPSSSNLRSAWLTFLSGFELSLVLLITTFLKFPALSATLILRVWASRGVVVLLMANSTKPSPRSEEFTSTHFVSSRLWIRLTIFVFTTLILKNPLRTEVYNTVSSAPPGNNGNGRSKSLFTWRRLKIATVRQSQK